MPILSEVTSANDYYKEFSLESGAWNFSAQCEDKIVERLLKSE